MATTSNPQPRPATTTIHEARLRLFQPTRRPRDTEQVLETAWGRVRIKGRLGQQHADVLGAIRHCAERAAPDGNRIKLLVDPARVRQVAAQASGTTFRHVLDDLLQVVIQVLEPENLRCHGHFIDHIDEARRADGTPITRPNPLTRGERVMWRVELGAAACKLISADLRLDYDPTPLARLDHGITAAVIRHVLTHRVQPHGGWTLNGLIGSVAGALTEQQMRDRRREVRADASRLTGFGLRLEGDRLRRVEQKPERVEQKPDSVEQKPGAWSKSLGSSGSSGPSGLKS